MPTLASVALITMGQSPSGDSCNRIGIGTPLLNGPTEFGPEHPAPTQWTTAPTKRSAVNDLLFCVRGSTTGRMNVADQEYAIGRGVASIRSIAHSSQRFVNYAVSFQLPALLSLATGSVFPNLSAAQIGSASIPNIPPVEQVAIAEVLGALDDKIAANRKLADTADALIRALYDNLPDREGHALADVCTNVRSQVTPRHGGLAYVGLEHVPRRHMWLHDWGDSATVTSAKTEFKTGDILFGKLRPYFHKVVSAPMSGISSTDILVLRPKYPELAGLVLAAASSDSVIADTSAASEGTRMPRTKWSLLSRCSMRWPGDDAALNFSRRVIEIRDAIDAMTRESQTLASLRDTLLPALMDGTIRVKDAETHVEEVL